MEAVCHFHFPSFLNLKPVLAIFIMKFLIAVGSKDYSGPTLELGMRVAKAFNAAVDIVYVGDKISAFSTSEVILPQQNHANWDFDRQGVDVLQCDKQYLDDNKYIKSESDEFNTDKLVQTDDDRCEVHLEGRMMQEVGLILRNGDIIQQLRDEVKRSGIDVTFIGASKKRRMIHDLIQYIDSSIFVVKNYDRARNYKLLLAVNDAPNTKKALKYGVRVAEAFELDVNAITISNTEEFRSDYREASNWADKFLRRTRVDHQVNLVHGKFIKVMNETAKDDHIIVMGNSTKSPLTKFFTGSKPLNVCEQCDCPALIVK